MDAEAGPTVGSPPRCAPSGPGAPWRIAHVVLSLDVGGLERVVLDLVREGRRLGPGGVRRLPGAGRGARRRRRRRWGPGW